MAKEQKEVEAEYLKMAKTDKPAADKMLNDFNLRIMADAEKLTEDLTNQLFTIRTKDIQSDIFFANAAKKTESPHDNHLAQSRYDGFAPTSIRIRGVHPASGF